MDPEIKDITSGLRFAIQFEGDGHNFYVMAAQNTGDEKGKEVLQMLAREELQHAKFLRHQYKSFLRTGKADPLLKLPHSTDLSGDHPIFSQKLKDRIEEAHMEMSALAIGVQLELNSIRFYRDEADKHDGAKVSDFYKELADWEKTHYDALLRQQESLKEDYWRGAGFEPF